MSGGPKPAAREGRARRNWLPFLPVVAFGGIAAAFAAQLFLGGDAQVVPSALLGRSAPQTVLPPLEGLRDAAGRPVPGLDLSGVGDGRPVLVNVFASWCVPCRQEHPLLMELARDRRLKVVAINYKDEGTQALAFLDGLGNPFEAVGVDPRGTATIDWGVYGVPESFLVSPDGEIVYKETGPFTRESMRARLLPALEALLARPRARAAAAGTAGESGA